MVGRQCRDEAHISGLGHHRGPDRTEPAASTEIGATGHFFKRHSVRHVIEIRSRPPDAANPDKQNNRKGGFRLFRENAGGKQRIKLNVGNGTKDTWVDGGAAADIDPTVSDWVQIAFTISATEATVYINGEVAKQVTIDGGVDWTDCDILSIIITSLSLFKISPPFIH